MNNSASSSDSTETNEGAVRDIDDAIKDGKKRNWFRLQFSLGMLLVVMTLVAILMPIIIEWKFSSRVPVKSSNILSVGHNPYTKTLEVEFRHGDVYRYKDVPRSTYKELIEAESVGRYFGKNIREGGYEYEKVE